MGKAHPALGLVIVVSAAAAQHRHPPQMQRPTRNFRSTW
jgi:hypothetical protein